jgi:hypothetical protein
VLNSEILKILSPDGVTVDGVWTGNRIYWTLILVKTSNYDSLTELQITNIIATHEVFSVFISRCLVAASTADVPLPLCSRTVTGLSYQLLISHNCNSLLVLVSPSTELAENVSSIFVLSRCQENVSTELFPSNGCCAVACLHSCYLAVGLHVTIL